MSHVTLPALRQMALALLAALFAGLAQPALSASITNNAPDPDGVLLNDGDDLTNNSTITNGAVASAAVRSTTGNVVSIANNGGASITGVGQSAVLIGDSGDPSFPNAANLGTFTNGGTITAGSTSFDAALDVGGNVGTFTNNSLMQATNYNAVYIHGNMTGTFTNNGTISTGADQTVRVQGTTGTFLNNTNGSITNTDGAAAVFVGNVTGFTNKGTMRGTDLGVRFFGNVPTLDNNGTIEATGGLATDIAVDIRGTGFSSMINTGTIKGGGGVTFGASAGAASIANSGTIQGTAGTAIQLTAHNDSLTLAPGSSITGIVDALGGDNATGDTFILGGTTGSASFDVSNIGAAAQYRNFENFFKSGGSTWTLSGTNTATMRWDGFGSGTLALNNVSMANTFFNMTSGTLSGTGTIGQVELANAAISPGGSGVGTLTTGPIDFAGGSSYAVTVAGAVADKIVVNGNANVGGGTVNFSGAVSTCGVLSIPILTTTGTLTATFTLGTMLGSTSLSYDAHNVFLNTSGGSGRTFSGFTNTANQASTAAALDAMGCGNQPYSAEINALTDAQVPGAMDALSGEGHAAIAATFVQTSHYLSDAIDKRIEQAFAALDGRGTVTAFAPGPMLLESFANATVWASGYGGFAAQAASGSASAINSAASGLVVGADGKVTEDWRMGLIAGLGVTGISAGATMGSSLDASVGGYGGAELGVVTIKMGAAYTRHFIGTTRSIVFPGVNDLVTASYQAGTAEAFFEVSTDFDVQGVTVSPFGRLLAVNHATDAFTETGGAGGALTTAASVSNALFVTLGVAAEDKFALTETMLVTARGSLGWQHAFGGTSTVSNSFAGGGPFTISSVPVASDAAVLSGGLVFDVSDAMNLAVTYDGMLGSGFASSAVTATLAGKF